MSWQTAGPPRGVPAPAAAGQALSLLETLGREGWSCLAACLEGPAAGPSAVAWLKAEGLVGAETLIWHGERRIPVLRLTADGKAYLRAHRKPVVRSEIETLQDRCGHALKPHYGQSLLFAVLARRAGYRTRLCVAVPTRTAIADVLLEGGAEPLWVSIESGLDRPLHPLDRWHRLAQIQAFLPLVAPVPDQQPELEERARSRIYVMRSTSLLYLLTHPPHRHADLWNWRYDRFAERAACLGHGSRANSNGMPEPRHGPPVSGPDIPSI